MVDAAGTTKYSYTAVNQVLTEDGPFSSDIVTNLYNNGLRVGLALQQPTGLWTNGFAYDISAVILPNIAILLIALMLHRHNARDPYGKLAAQGLRPGIMAKQVEDAKTAIVNERRMWSTFQDMSAHAHIDYEDQQGTRVSLDGPLSLKRESPARSRDSLGSPSQDDALRRAWKMEGDYRWDNQGTAISSENANLRATLSSLDMSAVLRLRCFHAIFCWVFTATIYLPRQA